MRQVDKIAEILEREGKISNFFAIHSRLSLRLGARIHDLRNDGWVIETRELSNKDTEYVLVAKPKAKQLQLV